MKFIGSSSPAYTISQSNNHSKAKLNEFLSSSTSAPNLLQNYLSYESMASSNKLRFPNLNQGRSFPVAQRAKDRSTGVPGPGAYSPPVPSGPSTSYKSCFVSNAKRNDLSGNLFVPSPNYYNTSNLTTIKPNAPKLTMAYKQDRNYQNDSPGPAKYSPKLYSLGGHVKIRKKDQNKRSLFDSTRVGPGSYYPEKFKETSSGVKIGKSTSGGVFSSLASDAAPGPGQYSPNFEMETKCPLKGLNKSAFTKESVLEAKKMLNVSPGAGRYFEDISYKPTSPVVSFTKASSHQKVPKEETPGPCAYDLPPIKSERYASMGHGQKTPFAPSLSTPGPGTYTAEILDREIKGGRIQPTKTMTDRKMAKEITPGPGHYNAMSLSMVSNSKNISKDKGFSGAERSSMIIGFKNGPGPGQYAQDDKAVSVSTGVSIGRARRLGVGEANADQTAFSYGNYNLVPTVPQPPPFERDLYEKMKSALQKKS